MRPGRDLPESLARRDEHGRGASAISLRGDSSSNLAGGEVQQGDSRPYRRQSGTCPRLK